jgi:hypothetical protein
MEGNRKKVSDDNIKIKSFFKDSLPQIWAKDPLIQRRLRFLLSKDKFYQNWDVELRQRSVREEKISDYVLWKNSLKFEHNTLGCCSAKEKLAGKIFILSCVDLKLLMPVDNTSLVVILETTKLIKVHLKVIHVFFTSVMWDAQWRQTIKLSTFICKNI